jgi:ribosomal protein L29
MSKTNEIKKKNDTELASLVSEKREAVRAFRFNIGGRDVRAKRAARKDIARALTELQARRQGAAVLKEDNA